MMETTPTITYGPMVPPPVAWPTEAQCWVTYMGAMPYLSARAATTGYLKVFTRLAEHLRVGLEEAARHGFSFAEAPGSKTQLELMGLMAPTMLAKYLGSPEIFAVYIDVSPYKDKRAEILIVTKPLQVWSSPRQVLKVVVTGKKRTMTVKNTLLDHIMDPQEREDVPF